MEQTKTTTARSATPIPGRAELEVDDLGVLGKLDGSLNLDL